MNRRKSRLHLLGMVLSALLISAGFGRAAPAKEQTVTLAINGMT